MCLVHITLILLRPYAAYLRHWSGSSLFQVMASGPFATKLLSERTLTYCQMVAKIFIEMRMLSLTKMRLKISSVKFRPSCLGFGVLSLGSFLLLLVFHVIKIKHVPFLYCHTLFPISVLRTALPRVCPCYVMSWSNMCWPIFHNILMLSELGHSLQTLVNMLWHFNSP